MAMQYIKKTQKFEGIRIYDPKQQGVAITHQFKGNDFIFFNNKRGCLIGKGLRPSLDMNGNTVTDYGWEEVVEHFKGMGFKVIEYDLKGKIKKAEKAEKPVPQQQNKPNTQNATNNNNKKEDNK